MKKIIVSLYGLLVVTVALMTFFNTREYIMDLITLNCALVATVLMLVSIHKFKVIKVEVELITAGFSFWVIGDILDFFQALGLQQDLFSSIEPYLYKLASVFFALACMRYLYVNIKEWHKFQLVIDAVYVIFITYLVFDSIYFENLSFIRPSLYLSVLNFLYVLTNVVMASCLLILISSKKKRKMYSLLKIYITSYVLYIGLELIHGVYYLSDIHPVSKWVDFMYVIFLAMLSIGTFTMEEDKKSQRLGEYLHYNYENIGKIRASYIIIGLAIVLLAIGSIDIDLFGMILFVTSVYIIIASYLKNLLRTEELLRNEKDLTHNLEDIIRDRTKELVKANARLEEQAERDVLTGLYNRSYFFKSLEEAIEKGQGFALLYLDLNRFKFINDLHGHSVGDQVIQVLSKRLQRLSFEDAMVSRIGGDEFGVIIHTRTLEAIEGFCHKIMAEVESTVLVDEYRFNLSISIGVARYPEDGLVSKDLVQHADIAMYHAKKNKNKKEVFMYDEDLVNEIERRNKIEWYLKSITFDDEFQVHYQPQFNIKNKELTGMEALIRWSNPELGQVSPAEFITIAEETNCIMDITRWVMKEAMKQIGQWNSSLKKPLTMGINISPMTFDAIEFLPQLKRSLKARAIEPSWLDFEITEHSAITAVDNMIPIFDDLSALGIKISIDDFGTGYSSLSYLKQFNINRIKIAKELIDNLIEDQEEQVIVKAIVMIAKGMHLSVIAEGVETQSQLEVLEKLGCDAIQGYYYGKPVSGPDFEKRYINP